MLTLEQVKERTNYLGSSDCAAILGMSRWKTPLQVWAEKTGAVATEDIRGELRIEVGNELEDLVCSLFTKRTGKKVQRVNEIQKHPKYDFIRAQIDRRVVGEDTLLEAKTCSAWKSKEWIGEEIPQEYILQVMHQLAVTGKSKGYIAVLIGGNVDFKWKEIDRDEALIRDILIKEVDFWNKYVATKTMPQIVTCGDTGILGQLFPKGNDKAAIQFDDKAIKLIESIKSLENDKSVVEDMLELEKNKLRMLLGENSLGLSDKYKVSWSNQITNRLDNSKIRKECPEVYEKYCNKIVSRVLRINEINKGE